MTGRIATQNLLALADKAAKGRVEVWDEVEDLAALIDAAVLHDEISYLDRGDQWQSLQYDISDLVLYLLDENVVRSMFPSEAEQLAAANLATGHLVAFLGTDRVDEVNELVKGAFTPVETTKALGLTPDTWSDHDTGRWLLREFAAWEWDPVELFRDDTERTGANFFIRSYLYIALANRSYTPLISDHVRVKLLETTSDRQALLRERILETMAASLPSAKSEDGRTRRPAVDAPLASIVFARCEGNVARLAEETRRLRNELAGTRAELTELELKAFGTESDVKKAEYKLDQVIGELDRNLNEYPGFRFQPAYFDLAGAGLGLATAPEDPTKWAAFLDALPVEFVTQWWHRRPIIEIHRLRDERPGMLRRMLDIEQLFGVVPGPSS